MRFLAVPMSEEINEFSSNVDRQTAGHFFRKSFSVLLSWSNYQKLVYQVCLEMFRRSTSAVSFAKPSLCKFSKTTEFHLH